jgi:hypothetical protein
LSELLDAQKERDRRLAELTEQLALKSTLLEQAEANGRSTSEAAKRAGQELLVQTSLVKQRDLELITTQARLGDTQTRLVDTQTRLRNNQADFDKVLLSRNQQIGQYEDELAKVRAEMEAQKLELETAHLMWFANMAHGWARGRQERTHYGARAT